MYLNMRKHSTQIGDIFELSKMYPICVEIKGYWESGNVNKEFLSFQTIHIAYYLITSVTKSMNIS